MTDFIACLTSGKGTWGHVARIITEKDFDHVILITDSFGKEKFECPKKCEFVVVDSNKPIEELIQDISNGIKNKVSPFDTVVNLVSGTGKEHMAILSSLLRNGIGFRQIVLTKDGIKEI